MIRSVRWGVAVWLLAFLPAVEAQEGKYTIKTEPTPIPKEIDPSIQKVLGPQATQLLDPAGKTICTVWLRTEIPVEATPEQMKNGLTYREVKQAEVLGAIRINEDWRDYRKQKVKAGTYTLRLGYQPMDGDHTGSSDFQDFLLILNASQDTKIDLLDAKALIEMSAKSIGSGHPGVFMLFPNAMPGQAPALAAMPKNHWVLQAKGNATINGKKTESFLGIGLTLVGAAD